MIQINNFFIKEIEGIIKNFLITNENWNKNTSKLMEYSTENLQQ